MNKETMIFVGLAIGAFTTSLACYEYNTIKVRKLEEKKVENEKLYFSKLTSEQVERIEKEKLEVKKAEIALKNTEAELKKTVTEYEAEIRESIQNKVMDDIHGDMRNVFDTWSAKFENRLENKIDNVVTRIDNLSDKYGGVKTNGTTPSINVVNAPNN